MVVTASQAWEGRQRVHWAEGLITSTYTRPCTLSKDVPFLYCSRTDKKRFRREAEVVPPMAKKFKDITSSKVDTDNALTLEQLLIATGSLSL